MKTLLIIVLSFISFSSIYSQNFEVDSLTSVKDELVIKKKEIIDSIKFIEIRINYIKSKEKDYSQVEKTYSETTTRIQAKIKTKPNALAAIIGYIETGENIKVFDYVKGYWLVEKDTLRGYANEIYLIDNSQMKKLRDSLDKNRETQRKDEFIKKHGKQIAYRISNHEIWIGMTTAMTKLSIGYPKDINRTTSTWGVREQWVYDNRYLYFEDGLLTSWQD